MRCLLWWALNRNLELVQVKNVNSQKGNAECFLSFGQEETSEDVSNLRKIQLGIRIQLWCSILSSEELLGMWLKF